MMTCAFVQLELASCRNDADRMRCQSKYCIPSTDQEPPEVQKLICVMVRENKRYFNRL